jgi:transcriptional regulator of acetoin/glycerol metabolism
LSEGSILEADDFSLAPERTNASTRGSPDTPRLDDMERDAIGRALAESDGNVSRAAAGLGLTRASLYRRKVKYGL